jgi:alcohol dehydrogenase (cytochrome c)
MSFLPHDRVRSVIILCLLLAGAAICAAQVTDQDLIKPDPANFLLYSGSYDSQRHSLLKQITTSNVGTLQAKWVFHVNGAKDLEATPIVYNGVMYISQYNRVHALDAGTGRLIWEYFRQPANVGWQRGVGIYQNKIFAVGADSVLIALDSRTGNPLWEAKPSQAGKRFQGPAPFVAKGKVIMSGSGEGGGFIEAFDTETGKSVWTWNAIPGPGEPGHETWMGDSWRNGGSPIWVSGSFDPALNLIYWGTGQPSPDFVGDNREGDNLYSDCIVALDLSTGKMKWYFQNTPHDVHDWDSLEMPVLIDAQWQGQPRKLLAQANRNGIYYILDRTNGKFLQGTKFVSKVDWLSGFSPEGRPILVPGHEPSVQGTNTCPSTAGATNWPSPAYSPDTKYFYLIAQEGCGITYRSTTNFRPGQGGSGTAYMESPNEQENWQLYVRALDALTGKKIWDFEQIGSHHYGPGLLSTAGGLIFAPEQQGMFTALDAKTGKPLWNFNTGALITASPSTYMVDGHQYVAIAAYANVFAFALPDAK